MNAVLCNIWIGQGVTWRGWGSSPWGEGLQLCLGHHCIKFITSFGWLSQVLLVTACLKCFYAPWLWGRGHTGSLVRMALCAGLASMGSPLNILIEAQPYCQAYSGNRPEIAVKWVPYRTTLCSGHWHHRNLHSELFAFLLAYPLWPLQKTALSTNFPERV